MKKFLLFSLFLPFCLASYAQQNYRVDFTHLQAIISIIPSEKKVEGDLTYTFDVLEQTDSIYIDARKMHFQNVQLNGREVDFFNDDSRIVILNDFNPSSENVLEVSYSATPSQAMYFVGWDLDEKEVENVAETNFPQVWTQGQGRYTSNWLPSFDDTSEKVEFDLTIDFPQEYQVVANGELLNSTAVKDSVMRWKYDMAEPMSSYLVAVAAGKFDQEEINATSGIPIQLYYSPRNADEVEPTYRYTREIFDFLEAETRVPYPWKNYKQVPVRDFLYAGMENTGTTIFSDLFVVDSIGFIDRNYVNVNAHELAHQWFGNLVTAASGEHHWLQEGFATYYALLAEKEIFGDDYFYWKLYESAEQLKEMSDEGKGESLLNPKASSLTFYQKGAWALHILKGVVGEEAFDLGVKNYLEENKFGNVTTSDFIEEVEKTSDMDLSGFVARWLKQSAFQGTEALNSLKKSPFMVKYLQIAALKEIPIENKRKQLNATLNFPVNQYIGQEVVYQLALEDPAEVFNLYKKAFETNDVYVRQAIAGSLTQIPQDLKSAYESLLSDDSYVTKELSLYNLWFNFPEDRSKYLDQMKGVEGFNDKNIRTLWLALNLATPGYDRENQSEVYAELSGYTSPYYPYQVRQNAFNYLFQLNSFSDKNLKDLLEATQNQVGSFRSFSRQLLQELLGSEEYQERFLNLKEELPERQADFLEQRLE